MQLHYEFMAKSDVIVGKWIRIPNFADGYYLNQNMVKLDFQVV
jgi:hypothetical protein